MQEKNYLLVNFSLPSRKGWQLSRAVKPFFATKQQQQTTKNFKTKNIKNSGNKILDKIEERI